MIRTESEYQEALARFKQDLAVIERNRQDFSAAGLTPQEVATALEPMQSFHAQLEEEITWYENVERGRFAPVRRLEDLGRLLIAARIASKLTQRDLAQRLGVSESGVSRDERNEYHGITLERAQRILDAIGYNPITTLEKALDNTQTVGLSGSESPLLEAVVCG